jgi:hypothetical protein
MRTTANSGSRPGKSRSRAGSPGRHESRRRENLRRPARRHRRRSSFDTAATAAAPAARRPATPAARNRRSRPRALERRLRSTGHKPTNACLPPTGGGHACLARTVNGFSPINLNGALASGPKTPRRACGPCAKSNRSEQFGAAAERRHGGRTGVIGHKKKRRRISPAPRLTQPARCGQVNPCE